jgi:general secretion pathway protein F
MPQFRALIHDPPHGVRRVRVQAARADAVAAALGISPLRLLGIEAIQSAPRRPLRGFSLRLFSQELALLLDAGVPLLEALTTLREKDAARPQSAVLERVLHQLSEGQSLSAALAGEPAAFDSLFVAIVSASERTGQLPSALRNHAAYLAWSEALRARIIAACVYPALLVLAGGAVVLFLLLYVLPRFAGVFDSLGSELPAASRWLIDFGVWTAAHPTPIAVLLLALPATVAALWAWPRSRAALRTYADAALLRSPGLGPRLRTVALARLYRGLGLLLSAGVTVLPAMRLLHGVLPHPMSDSLVGASHAVQGGRRLSEALHEQALATPVALRMLRVGESSGSVPAMLERAAAFHDEEIARLADIVTRAVNPVLMLVMGVLIGGIVVLMYMPIFSLMEQVQ